MKLSLVAQMVFVVIFASLLATPTPTSASNPTKRPKSKRVSGEPSLRHRPSTRRPATTTPQRVVDEQRSQRHQQQSHRQQLQQQRELVKKTLLSILGLKSEPKPRGKVRVPIYMMKLYDELSRRNHLRQQQQQQLAPKIMKRHGKRSQYDGDTIRSFQAIFVDDDLNEARFFFNVSSNLANDHLNGAELRLYLHSPLRPDTANRTRRHSTETTRHHHRHQQLQQVEQYRISVYQLAPDPGTRGEPRLLDAKVVDASLPPGWESFDVSQAVTSWQTGSEVSHELEVKVTTVDNRPVKALDHVRIRRSVERLLEEEKKEEEEEMEPLLITYADYQSQHDRSQNQQRQEHRPKRRRSSRVRKRASGGRRKNPGKGSVCRRRSLSVDFSELEWNDWIIAPPGYDAFMCNGTCPVILPDHLNATNHAQVQSLLHSVNRALVPPPCCVPTELSPISMLYVDETDKVVLKNYQDMVVMACGCR